MAVARSIPFTGTTAWARNLASPIRDFLSTETGSAALMLAATLAALAWANAPGWHSYESLWTTELSIHVGSAEIAADLRHWVNEGLMTFFFLVVGLEAKRELDMGELRERTRLAVPVLAALGGMAVPILIYLAFNAGRSGAHGWGAAMSTDTAFALGALAVIAPRGATRLRVFLLTLAVFDDLVALVVIAAVYSGAISPAALAAAAGFLVALLALRYAPPRVRRALWVPAGIGMWVALFESGVDPVITGVIVGLATSAYPPSREDLERATELTRSFREQPTAELARSAQQGLLAAVSPNERLQQALHPWTSYVVVPLFALANAGIHITSGLLGEAVSSPITLGIVVGYVAGKPLGILAASWLATRPALRGPRPLVGWPVLGVGGAVAGIGFTVSLLISSRAFHGQELAEAKIGVLAAAVLATLLAAVVTAVVQRLPARIRARQAALTAAEILDLADEVDPERDHIRGPDDAPVTLVEYGDFECPYCGQAERVIRELLDSFGDELRYVWRHLPLSDVHLRAQLASEAAEAGAAQDSFWRFYETLLAHQDALTPPDLGSYAEELGLDVDRFWEELRHHEHAERVAEDVASADASGVTGTPTFFINGRRHYGAYDVETLTAAVRAARGRSRLLSVAAGQER
jgi:Na+/H+ antiporter NhaA